MPNRSIDTHHPDAALLNRWRRALDAWEAATPQWPTSQILGGGAIDVVEDMVSQAHQGRPCLLLPSATYALRLALATAGVIPGDPVTVIDDPWPAGAQAAHSLGAAIRRRPILGDEIAPPTGTVIVTDPANQDALDPIPIIRNLSPNVILIEDASRLHPTDSESPVRRRSGDYIIYSLGPAKPCDAGEGGLLILPDLAARNRALSLSAHPTRLAYEQLESDSFALPMRVHPVAAVLAWYVLTFPRA